MPSALPEMFALIFFGLNVAASVGAETFWKGWLSVVFGLLLACIGTDPAGGLTRFAFGTYYLLAGIHFIPLILGFFAISEVFVQAEKMVTLKYKAPKVGIDIPLFQGFLEHEDLYYSFLDPRILRRVLPGNRRHLGRLFKLQ